MSKNQKEKRSKWNYKLGLADTINYIALSGIILVCWHYVTTKGEVSSLLLPSIEQVKRSFLLQLNSGQLINDVVASVITVGKGFLVGSILGMVFGILMGAFDRFNKFFSFIFDAIRQIPGLAWFPLIILWFGIGDLSKIILVARGTFFPVLVNTIDGINATNPRYMDLVKLYKVKTRDVILKIYVPSALPFLCVGLRLGASTAWMSVVAAEMLGASSGLGFRIANSQQLMQSDVMIVDILIIGVLGWIIDVVLKKVTVRMTRWCRV